MLINNFPTAAEAQAYVRKRVDVPTPAYREDIGGGVSLRAFSQDLGNGRFTNVYDMSYQTGKTTPVVQIHEKLTSVYDFAVSAPQYRGASIGGFFFLADRYGRSPRQLALNLAIAEGHVRSLPVIDREAIVVDNGVLVARQVHALGALSINGAELSWSGSLTNHETDCKVYGNGNAIITQEQCKATGSIRVLDETSRYTPLLAKGSEKVDIGFIAREDGIFVAGERSTTGGVDIFAHDMVVRCHERNLANDLEMKVHTIGSVAVSSVVQGALSVGPMLTDKNFEQHPINRDASLGSKPPLLERPLARSVLYETESGSVHIRLYDGRPGSETFTGVTPNQAAYFVQAEEKLAWGCFLDSGQTAKLCARTSTEIASLGNSHYIKWPDRAGEDYMWVPKIGRPVASLIALQ
ncbi:MAG TPA: hypothetical protein VFT53_02575 [Candidatus Saccharimonadales bacterium]|nr:hypothetical protein [Candidatus Saccharimonadales bacterium]